MEPQQTSFETSVFINCPFDDEYKPILELILFTVIQAGLTPRIASDTRGKKDIRFERIVNDIQSARYSIHDLSRTTPEDNKSVRFNMPFELGLDFGMRYLSTQLMSNPKTASVHDELKLSTKKFLILEHEKYTTDRVLSDIAPADASAHGSDPMNALKAVRKWINNTILDGDFYGTNALLAHYADFCSNNVNKLLELGYSEDDIEDQSIPELITAMQAFTKTNIS
jgi:hypothetical protein